MGGGNKLLLPLGGRPVLLRTVEAFAACPLVTAIVLAVSEETASFFDKEIRGKDAFGKVLSPAPGGPTRQGSVENALKRISGAYDLVLVHDGARPRVSEDIIEAVIRKAEETGAAAPVVPLKDTIKEVAGGVITATPERGTLRAVQTPQGFRTGLLVRAFENAASSGLLGTDEASLVEAIGHAVSVVPGSYENIKITTPEDMLMAETLLKNRG